MTIPNDPPNPCISHSKSKPMAPHRGPISPTTDIWTSNMIPFQLNPPTITRPTSQHTNHISMMTGYRTRRYLPRTPHTYRPKRFTVRHNPFYSLRSIFLHRFLLSLLPLKSRSNPRTRGLLTTHRHPPPKPPRSPSPKYICSPSFRCIHHLSPPQPNGGRPQEYITSPTHHNPTGRLLHLTPGLRILRNPLYNCRRSIWIYILHGYWIPWPTRNYRLHIFIRVFHTTTKIPLHL